MHHRFRLWREEEREREKALCGMAVYLLKMALRMGWDWRGRGTRFLQLVVRNPIPQLSCLEISISALSSLRKRTWRGSAQDIKFNDHVG